MTEPGGTAASGQHGFLPFTGGWWLSLAIFCAIMFVVMLTVGLWKDWRRGRRRQRDLAQRRG